MHFLKSCQFFISLNTFHQIFHIPTESSGNFLFPYIWSAILKNCLSPDTLRKLLSLTTSISCYGSNATYIQKTLLCEPTQFTRLFIYTVKMQKHNLKTKIEATCNVKRGKSRVLQLVGHMQCKNSIERIFEGASHMLKLTLYYKEGAATVVP